MIPVALREAGARDDDHGDRNGPRVSDTDPKQQQITTNKRPIKVAAAAPIST
jgi:hypothetical protein